MTAFMFKRFDDRIEIVSDGAQYRPDGTIVGKVRKVSTSDTVPLVIMGSGHSRDIDVVAASIFAVAKRTGSVDATLYDLMLALGDIDQAAPPPPFDRKLRIAIAAISETEGPVTLMFDTFADERNAHGPFTLVPTARWFGQGGMPDPLEMVRAGVTMESPLVDHAVSLFEQMRQTKKPNFNYPDQPDIYSIGGHLDFTVVTADGYTSRRIHEWPEDVIGEKIRPNREAA